MAIQEIKKPSSNVLTGSEDFNGLTSVPEALPSQWYFSEQWYEQELNQIFYDNWLYLCHHSTLTEVGEFRKFTIGDQSIFLVKDSEGEIRGFHNTCRHRGSAICTEEKGQFRNRLIRCPYHQWAYDLKGNLKATSSQVVSAEFNFSDYPLFPIAVTVWRGGIFISFKDDSEPLENSFIRGNDRTENWPLQDLKIGHTWSKVMKCNWKVFWENFNECLHCPNVHPELSQLVPVYGRRFTAQKDDPNWREHEDSTDPRYVGGLRDGAQTWSTNGEALNQQFTELSEEEIHRGQSYFVSLPSVFIAAHVDYMRSVRVLPLGPEETEISVEWLFMPEQLEDENFDHRNITDFAILVMEQDAEASELNQLGMRSNKYEHGVLMPEEHYVKNFQDWVRSQVVTD